MVKTRRSQPDTRARCPLPPFPDGWYIVALSRGLNTETLVGRQWMGRPIVVWRGREGVVCVADAYCAHLGARLSPETGGRLRNGRLVCPFHGFEYDASGTCVATPNAPPPRTCRLRCYPVQEVNGFVFAYWDNEGREPDWKLPELDEEGWSRIACKWYTVRSHPQDIAENSVDINHLSSVHGWEGGERSREVEVDGRHYLAGFRYNARPNMPGLGRFRYEASPDVHVWGLGYARTDSRSDAYGMDVRNWYLPAPVDVMRFKVLVVTRIRKSPAGNGRAAGLLGRLGIEAALRLIMYEATREFEKDLPIWNHRAYHERPALCASDGDLFRFRRYCRQFYPKAADNG